VPDHRGKPPSPLADFLGSGPEEGEDGLAGIELLRQEVPDIPAVEPSELRQLQPRHRTVPELDLGDRGTGELKVARHVLLPKAGGFAGFPKTAGEIDRVQV
jgi:hypothetical protein